MALFYDLDDIEKSTFFWAKGMPYLYLGLSPYGALPSYRRQSP